MPRKTAAITRRTLRREIRVKMDEDAKDEITKNHVDVLNRIDLTRTMAADTAAQYRKTVKELEEEEKHLRTCLQEGVLEEHEVEEIRDTNKNTLTVKRVDTGEVVEERELTDDDNQLDLDEEEEDDEDRDENEEEGEEE